MREEMKQLIKEAILEALIEFTNQGTAPASGDGPIEPDPPFGPSGFGLR